MPHKNKETILIAVQRRRLLATSMSPLQQCKEHRQSILKCKEH
jgi:hypothetical protein